MFLAATTPWVYALATSLAETFSTRAVQFFDWRTARNRPGWPPTPENLKFTRSLCVLPPGYAGRFEWLARPFLQRAIKTWSRELEEGASSPWVIAPYPYLAPWVRHLPDSRLIYYNLDDYRLYDMKKARRTTSLEDELIARAAWTLCLSKTQQEALRQRHPQKANHIVHFPLAVTEALINPAPGSEPSPNTVGYVGNLIDRVDWELVGNVARLCPELQFQFIGSLATAQSETPKEGWMQHRAAALSLPNVKHVEPVPQESVNNYYWKFAVNWIPYDIQHPFNIASCPTKIMDAMASGRPIVSTSVPECVLYPDWIRIADTPGDIAQELRSALRLPNSNFASQTQFARANTWHRRADELISLLSGTPHQLTSARSF